MTDAKTETAPAAETTAPAPAVVKSTTPKAPAKAKTPAKPKSTPAAETKASLAKVNGTSKPESKFEHTDARLAKIKKDADPAVDGVTALTDADEVAERSPDGSTSGKFTKAFILDRLDLDANGKTPESFDHNANIDGTRHFGVQSGVRFTGPVKLISDEPNEVAPGTRVLTYGGKAVPASARNADGTPVRDHYDPTVTDAGKTDETVKSNSAEAKAGKTAKSKTSTK